MSWQFMKMGADSAQRNMETDRQLLDKVVSGVWPATWRFYSWKQPTFSFGYSQRIEEIADVEACRRAEIEWVQRPTGGGLVIHGWDLTYTVLAPADDHCLPRGVLASYKQIHQWIVQALHRLDVPANLTPGTDSQSIPGLCLNRVAPYDILLDGQKIAGGAQRRRKGYLLHQGYIALDHPPADVLGLAGISGDTGHINQQGRHIKRQELIDVIQEVVLEIGNWRLKASFT